MSSRERSTITFQWHSLSEMDRVATICAVLWCAPAVVLLEGDLGVGKTALVQAVLKLWGVRGRVKSPTFDLVHIYELTSTTVYHADLYRIRQAEELETLDLPEPLSHQVLLVEWGEWVRDWYPERWDAHLTRDPDGTRVLALRAHGRVPVQRMAEWGETAHANHWD